MKTHTERIYHDHQVQELEDQGWRVRYIHPATYKNNGEVMSWMVVMEKDDD